MQTRRLDKYKRYEQLSKEIGMKSVSSAPSFEIQGNGNIRFWIKSVFEFALMAGLITVIMAYCVIIRGG